MYYVVEAHYKDSSPMYGNDHNVNGPFSSQRAAENWIRTDALAHFSPEGIGRDEEYGGQYTIVKALKTVQPVPIVSVRCELIALDAAKGKQPTNEATK